MAFKHIGLVTKKPGVAQTNLQIKLEGTTAIIDRFLLADRQAPWKVGGPFDGEDTDTDTDTGGGGLGGQTEL